MRWLALVVGLSCSLAFSADPQYTGHWILDETQSEMHAMPSPAARVLRLQLAGKALTCSALFDAKDAENCSFTLDRKETRHSTRGGTRSIAAKWEGTAILVNTIVQTGSTQHTEMDRWKLSRDSQKLTIRRQVVNRYGESESTLVYDRRD